MELLMRYKIWVIAIMLILGSYVAMETFKSASKDLQPTLDFLTPVKPKK